MQYQEVIFLVYIQVQLQASRRKTWLGLSERGINHYPAHSVFFFFVKTRPVDIDLSAEEL